MASITIRQFDDDLKQKLRMQAALHGWSMEEEARVILRQALVATQSSNERGLAQRIHQCFAALGGVELPIAEREAIAKTYGATLATRNIKDFECCEIKLVNPWL